jgi:DNA-binding MarR family transcriptional regulator
MQVYSVSGTDLEGQLTPLFSAILRAGSTTPEWRGLTSTQRLLVSELVSSGPLRLGALAERVGATDPTTSRAVDGLVAAGLVARRADPADRRAVLHEATPRGRRRVEARRAEVAAILDSALARFTSTERRQLVELLAKLNEQLRTAKAPTPTELATR